MIKLTIAWLVIVITALVALWLIGFVLYCALKGVWEDFKEGLSDNLIALGIFVFLIAFSIGFVRSLTWAFKTVGIL